MIRNGTYETDISREQLLHLLYEAAELEHCLMCTYLYAAFSLKTDEGEGLTSAQLAMVRRWRQVIMQVATEEMSHLVAVWNITAALGAAPRIGRQNLPLDPGYLPASVVVRLAPFNIDTLQHFIYLERPGASSEPDGAGFAIEQKFVRGTVVPRITPMAFDYATVGEFYEAIGRGLRGLVTQFGEATTFCGDPSLQVTTDDVGLAGLERVICLKTALLSLDTIVEQGEGAREESESSHFQRFCSIREELRAEQAANPGFEPAHPAATNPVLRIPPRAAGRVLIENPSAAEVVDVANSAYGLMLRLLAYAYAVPVSDSDKAVALDLSIGLMHAFTLLAEHAARIPVASGSASNAGVSFITLRDSAAFPPGSSARLIFCERMAQLTSAAHALDQSSKARTGAAIAVFDSLLTRALAGFNVARMERGAPALEAPESVDPVVQQAKAAISTATSPTTMERVRGEKLTILYEGKRCIHARFCVTGAPKVFLANVEGPWIHPDAMDVERLVDIAHACPSGAIRYTRHDGRPEEEAPPVNLLTIREAGPYALRGDLLIDGEHSGYRATLCRCGASKNKPYCDGSHREAGFTASGEPATGSQTAMPESRDGPLSIELQRNGPLHARGNLEIVSGTGRLVARVGDVRLCRCGGSGNKPFCDGSHMRNGFTS